MRFLVSALFGLLFGSVTFAQTVAVRTGEHADFTRVVLSITDGTDWRLGRNPGGYTIRLQNIDGYQLEDFFEIIPRTRISSVTQEAGDLQLGINCVCNAQAFVFRDNFLVVDVRDGPANRISAFELSLDKPEMSSPERDIPQSGGAPAFSIAENRAIPLFVTPDDMPVPSPRENLGDIVTEVAPIGPDPGAQDIVAEISEEVATALGVALSSGFLEGEISADSDVEEQAVDMSTLLEMSMAPGIETRTSIDPASGLERSAIAETQAGAACLPDAFFAIETWGDDRPFHIQVGEARQNLYGEFDRPDADAVVALAKVFLHFGFGKEALQSLRLDNGKSQERLYLQRIARIVDGAAGPIDGFSGQISCNSKVGMWAALALGDQPLDGQIDRATVLRELKTLPSHLQPVLGPRLARVFTRIGDQDAAIQVLDRAVSEGLDPVASAMGTSDLAAASGNVQQAFDAVQEVVLSGEPVTSEVMAEYFDLGVETGNLFTPADFQLAEAIRFEGSGSNAANRLLIAQFSAHLAQNNFQQARRILDGDATVLDDEQRQAMNADFQNKAVLNMDDGGFGRLVWSESFAPATEEIGEKVIQRLDSMGFSDRAREIAQGNDATQSSSADVDQRPTQAEQADVVATTAERLEPNNDDDFVDAGGSQLSGEATTAQLSNPSLADALLLLEASETSRATVRDRLLSLPVDQTPQLPVPANGS